MDTDGKAILITGASRGIGAATARRLARAGMALGLCGRDAAALDAVAAACRQEGADVALFVGDVTDDAYAESLAQRTHDAFGRLDALFNNAGVLAYGAMQDADLARWEHVLDVNFRSWLRVTQPAIPLLTAREESAIINLCSVAGRLTSGGGGIYSATKHAVHAWSQCLFEDLRAQGVKVSAIYPGYVATDMTAGVPGDHDKMIQPDDIAQTVEFVLRFPGAGCPTEIVVRPQRPLS